MDKQQEKKPLVSIKNLYKIFGKNEHKVLEQVKAGKSKNEILAETGHTVGLSDINLDIYPGEIFVIMGLSGSGKSTLIRHFNRLIEPTAGEIEIAGSDVMKLDSKGLQDFRRNKMSMVFQRFGLMPHRTVIENIGYGLQVQGIAKDIRNTKATEWLDTVGLAGYANQYPNQLSGGQQQRVGLARALCTDADILLMDEAFSALDPLIRSEMQDQLIELQDKLHKTIIFITHDLDEALRIGDKIAILRMQPQICRISAENIGEAVIQMRKSKQDYGYVMNDEGYQGVITQETLEGVEKGDYDNEIDSALLEDVPSVQSDALLESVISEMLDNEHPLPVLNAEGEVEGHLSRSALSDALSDTAEEETDKAS